MNLILTRPIAFFDIESTGPNSQNDRIIELSIILLFPDFSQKVFEFKVHPGIAIPAGSTEIHGITDEMVKDCPKFAEIAPQIVEVIEGCDLGGFMSNNFDIPMLDAEMRRVGIDLDFTGIYFVDAGVIFKQFAPRTLSAAVKTYLDKELEGAHGATADIRATVDVLLKQVDTHFTEPQTVEQLALISNYGKKRLDLAGKFAYREDGVEIFAFGQHKGEPVAREKSYLEWMLKALDKEGKPSFSQDTKNVINRLMGRDPERVNPGPAVLPKIAYTADELKRKNLGGRW